MSVSNWSWLIEGANNRRSTDVCAPDCSSFRAHSMFDAELYREKAEVERWKERDPLKTLVERLITAGLRQRGQNVVVMLHDKVDQVLKIVHLLEMRHSLTAITSPDVLQPAARRDHVDTLIAPALARGAIVLCDRFVDSTRVYQGAVAGLEGKLLSRLEAAATSGRMPDLTIVIDVPVAIGFERARRRREALGEATDRFESESLAFHEKVRAAFLALAAAEPERCVVVDGAGSAEDAGAAIWSAVTAHLVGRALKDGARNRHSAASRAARLRRPCGRR